MQQYLLYLQQSKTFFLLSCGTFYDIAYNQRVPPGQFGQSFLWSATSICFVSKCFLRGVLVSEIKSYDSFALWQPVRATMIWRSSCFFFYRWTKYVIQQILQLKRSKLQCWMRTIIAQVSYRFIECSCDVYVFRPFSVAEYVPLNLNI